jgi:hypothetical protein
MNLFESEEEKLKNYFDKEFPSMEEIVEKRGWTGLREKIHSFLEITLTLNLK